MEQRDDGPHNGPDPAIGRYYLLQLVRFACAGVALAGAMVLNDTLDAPPWLGGLALLAGAAGFFFLPNRVARRWRSPEE